MNTTEVVSRDISQTTTQWAFVPLEEQVTGTTPTNFPKFAELPMEIQVIIWKMVRHASRRVIEGRMSCFRNGKKMKCGRYYYDFLNQPLHTIRLFTEKEISTPAILHTCHVSRLIARQTYKRFETSAFVRNQGKRSIWKKYSDMSYWFSDLDIIRGVDKEEFSLGECFWENTLRRFGNLGSLWVHLKGDDIRHRFPVCDSNYLIIHHIKKDGEFQDVKYVYIMHRSDEVGLRLLFRWQSEGKYKAVEDLWTIRAVEEKFNGRFLEQVRPELLAGP